MSASKTHCDPDCYHSLKLVTSDPGIVQDPRQQMSRCCLQRQVVGNGRGGLALISPVCYEMADIKTSRIGCRWALELQLCRVTSEKHRKASSPTGPAPDIWFHLKKQRSVLTPTFSNFCCWCKDTGTQAIMWHDPHIKSVYITLELASFGSWDCHALKEGELCSSLLSVTGGNVILIKLQKLL